MIPVFWKAFHKLGFGEPVTAEPTMKKTVKIANFKGQPRLEPRYIENELTALRAKLQLLLNDERPQISLELMFRAVETMVAIDRGEAIFQLLCDALQEFLQEKLRELTESEHEDWLDFLVSSWMYYREKVLILKNVFLCLDRCCKNNVEFNRVHVKCMEMFKSVVVLNFFVSQKITRGLMKVISVERALGFNVPDYKLTVEMIFCVLNDLGVYKEIFQSPFLFESQHYFQEEGLSFRENRMDVNSYLRHTYKQVRNEMNRPYLRQETTESVLTILYREMIERHIEAIMNQGFQQLMDSNNLEILELLYKLFSQVPDGLEIISEHLMRYSHTLALKIVQKNENMIENLLTVKDKLDNIVDRCFQRNSTYLDTVKGVIEEVANVNSTQSALCLVKFLDLQLRSKHLDEEQFEETLQKVISLFRLIQGKDLFEAFYRKDLAKRLIFGTSTNHDMEKNVVVKLKELCGEGYTSTLEGMLKDIELSSNFKELLNNSQDKFDVSVAVLTSSFWSKSMHKTAVLLPDNLLHYQDVFSKHYTSIHSGRKLDWQPNMGHCLVKATFGDTVKELQVSLYQTVVLLLFNENERLSTQQIQTMTKLELKDLVATLHSLSLSKHKILLKQPAEGAINSEDVFEVNNQFTAKLYRIKINQAQFKENSEDVKTTESAVLTDRQFQIDAAIVRILKRRKVVSHNELLTELFQVLDVPIHSQVLKKRIELLIEREYIKRDFDNVATYTYVA